MTLDFNATPADYDTIQKIVARAESLWTYRSKFPRITAMMDLLVVRNRYGLDVAALLDADDFNFLHDITGIAAHLNRETGELEDCFMPRFARMQ